MALPTDRLVFDFNPTSDDSLWRDLYPYQRTALSWLLRPKGKQQVSVCLPLPWGQMRNFLVPAADPYNQIFAEASSRGMAMMEHQIDGSVRVVGYDEWHREPEDGRW